MPIFYPPVDFAKPPSIDKSGDYAEFNVSNELNSLDNSWHVFHHTEWRTVDKYGERVGEVDLILSPDFGVLCRGSRVEA